MFFKVSIRQTVPTDLRQRARELLRDSFIELSYNGGFAGIVHEGFDYFLIDAELVPTATAIVTAWRSGSYPSLPDDLLKIDFAPGK